MPRGKRGSDFVPFDMKNWKVQNKSKLAAYMRRYRKLHPEHAEKRNSLNRLAELTIFAIMNLTINRIIENHRTAFEVYRLKAKADAKELRSKAKKLMQDFDLQEKDME